MSRSLLTSPAIFPAALKPSIGSGLADHSRVSALRHVQLIAAKEFGDRLRSGWVIGCVLVWLGAVGLTSFFGLLQIGLIGVQGYERTVVSLLNLVQYLVPLLGLLLGHDLVVSEADDRTLQLMIAGGVSRTRLLFGKFMGGCLTLTVPLALGFAIAGTVIGLAAGDSEFGSFLTLAFSGLMLGIVFLAIGLALSTFSRTRVQALVLALLTWCVAVFVFDLVALGMLVSTRSAAAAQEIEVVCDSTHVNAAADIHTAYDTLAAPNHSTVPQAAPSLGWLALDPVDLFRAINLPTPVAIRVPLLTTTSVVALWLAAGLGCSRWKLGRTDL